MNMFAYCENNPVLRVDAEGKFWGLVLAVVGVCTVIGGIFGAVDAAATDGDVVEGAIEGCINGGLSAICGLLITNPVAAVVTAFGGSVLVDVGTQVTSQYIKTGEVDLTEVDTRRTFKVGLQTAAGTAIPAFGNTTANAVDAFGTALIWSEGAILITCADIVYERTRHQNVFRKSEKN